MKIRLGDLKKMINEEVSGCSTSEMRGSYMSHQNLAKLDEYSTKIHELLCTALESGMELDDWVEDKISGMADDISEVYHYVHQHHSGDSQGHVHEGPVKVPEKMKQSRREKMKKDITKEPDPEKRAKEKKVKDRLPRKERG